MQLEAMTEAERGVICVKLQQQRTSHIEGSPSWQRKARKE
jgi:hypothetical protein